VQLSNLRAVPSEGPAASPSPVTQPVHAYSGVSKRWLLDALGCRATAAVAGGSRSNGCRLSALGPWWLAGGISPNVGCGSERVQPMPMRRVAELAPRGPDPRAG